MKDLVTVSNVSKHYGKKTVLDEVNLVVKPGEIIGLIGENGAGKSTLINIINSLAQPSSGTVKLAIARGKIGVMLQGNLTLNRVRVKEAIELARSYYPEPMNYADLLRLSGLKDQENLMMAKISGGQKRRLSFVLALAGNPDLIFLDEPTTGMDTERRESFWQEITGMAAAGKTFFITSHYLEELENIATRLLLLDKQKIVFDGTIADLRGQHAQSEITFTFEGNLPQLANSAQIARTGNFHRLTTDRTNDLLKELVPLLDGIANLTIQQNSLDNMFKNLVKGENDRLGSSQYTK